MEWLYVIIAGLIEIVWVIGLKHADNSIAWIGVVIAILISFWLLFKSYAKLPVGTVYAVFTGIGTAGLVLVDIFVFGEPFSVLKIVFIGLLFTGVVGLKKITGDTEQQERGN
ncbi:DMT family transporter [Microbacteriaceae bacterium 4G12]